MLNPFRILLRTFDDIIGDLRSLQAWVTESQPIYECNVFSGEPLGEVLNPSLKLLKGL